MYVFIDSVVMKLQMIHSNRDALHELVNLECAKTYMGVYDDTEREGFLSWVSAYNLNLLWRNTFLGNPTLLDSTITIVENIALACNQFKPRMIADNIVEQVNSVSPTNLASPNYVYNPKGGSPTVSDNVPYITFPNFKLLDADTCYELHRQRQVRSEALRVQAAKVAMATPGPSRTAGSAPVGGVRAAVWEHAGKGWLQAGSPKDPKVILALRKAWMNELEVQGIGRNTASNFLGEWMRNILAQS